MQPVESGHIEAIGYEESTRMLTVKFRKSEKREATTYHISNISPEQHAELMAAESKGSHFNKFIRGKEEHPAKKVAA